MSRIRHFIEQWVQQTGLPVVLAPEVDREIEGARQHIFNKLSPSAQEKCVQFDEFWTPEQAYSLYR